MKVFLGFSVLGLLALILVVGQMGSQRVVDLSYFPDPDSRRQSQTEETALAFERKADSQRLQSSEHYPEMVRGISTAFVNPNLRVAQSAHNGVQTLSAQAGMQRPAFKPKVRQRIPHLHMHSFTAIMCVFDEVLEQKTKSPGMSIVEMAIRDISRHHDQRLQRVLKSEMDSAAKDYADDIDKAVHWEKQSEGERAQSRAAEENAEEKTYKQKGKKMIKHKTSKHKKQDNGWSDLF